MIDSTRKVICADALEWLSNFQAGEEVTSIVASLPDFSEFPDLSLEEWKEWFISTSELALTRTSNQGVTLFFQSDIKHQGAWVDKSYLCQKAAERQGHQLLWHKIFCRSPVGIGTFGRPAYSHLLCFSRDLRLPAGKASPDVFSTVGEKAWQRGMGLEVCLYIARFLKEQTETSQVLNPFCGVGSMLPALELVGLPAIGIEKSKKRARDAEKIRLIATESNHWTWDQGNRLDPIHS